MHWCDMAKSDKDNPAKNSALKFCVASGMLSFTEVNVFTSVDLTSAPKIITDIDVLGIWLRQDGSISKSIFDCKSTGGPAIARALWLSGLLKLVGAEDGMLLMGKPAERAHRLAARQLGINVFGSGGFDNFASATNPEYAALRSYGGDLNNWHLLHDAAQKFSPGGEILHILHQEVPLTQDVARSFRRVISRILPLKGELNPAKSSHLAIFNEICVCMALMLTMMVGDLRNILDLNEDEKEFGQVVRYYLWGGPEGVANLRRLYELLRAHDSNTEQETALVAWPNLLQLLRGLLEAPTMLRSPALGLRELALRQLAKHDDIADRRTGQLFAEARSRQFAKRIALYSAAVLKLPTEFADRIAEQIDTLVELAAT